MIRSGTVRNMVFEYYYPDATFAEVKDICKVYCSKLADYFSTLKGSSRYTESYPYMLILADNIEKLKEFRANDLEFCSSFTKSLMCQAMRCKNIINFAGGKPTPERLCASCGNKIQRNRSQYQSCYVSILYFVSIICTNLKLIFEYIFIVSSVLVE
jgi:hypothetical protein